MKIPNHLKIKDPLEGECPSLYKLVMEGSIKTTLHLSINTEKEKFSSIEEKICNVANQIKAIDSNIKNLSCKMEDKDTLNEIMKYQKLYKAEALLNMELQKKVDSGNTNMEKNSIMKIFTPRNRNSLCLHCPPYGLGKSPSISSLRYSQKRLSNATHS